MNFIKVIDAYEEENSTDVLLGSIDCFTEDTYEMFNKKGYNGKERIDYLVGKIWCYRCTIICCYEECSGRLCRRLP